MTALTSPGERERFTVKLKSVDWSFCLCLAGLAGAGGAMLYSMDGSKWTPWALPHLAVFALCFLAMVGLACLDLRVWFSLAYPIYGVGLLLLLAVAAHGHATLGAKRWLDIGPIRLQPSEIIKVGLVLALARFYHTCPADKARLSKRLLFPAFLILLPTALVAHQPDLGTAVLIFVTGGTVMILAGLSLRLVGIGVLGLAAAVPAAFLFVLKGYQKARLLTFLHPQSDRSGSGWHIIQSEIALGSGGLLGKGFGLGTQSALNFLPEKQTDFIFASLAEEFGFLGCSVILLLYAAVIFIALRIAATSHSHFGRLAAAGVTVTFGLCVLINGAMTMGLAPVVGVPMPLLSYGGSVMISMMAGMGLILAVRVHRYSEVTSGRAGMI